MCLITQLSSLFLYVNHYLAAQESDLQFFIQERGYNYARAEHYLHKNKFILDGITHEQSIIICRQLFAGYAVGPRPMKRRENKCIER